VALTVSHNVLQSQHPIKCVSSRLNSATVIIKQSSTADALVMTALWHPITCCIVIFCF